MKKLITISLTLLAVNAFSADGSAYKGKVMFIQQHKHVSHCFPVGLKSLQTLADYKSCDVFKAENGPLQKAVAKCDKEDGSAAYMFQSEQDCTNAQSDIADGNATVNP